MTWYEALSRAEAAQDPRTRATFWIIPALGDAQLPWWALLALRGTQLLPEYAAVIWRRGLVVRVLVLRADARYDYHLSGGDRRLRGGVVARIGKYDLFPQFEGMVIDAVSAAGSPEPAA